MHVPIDERGFDDSSISINSLSLQELKEKYAELAREIGRKELQINELRRHNRELKQLLSVNSDQAKDLFANIRHEILRKYLVRIFPKKTGRGNRSLPEYTAYISEIAHEYHMDLLSDPMTLPLKTWIRMQLETAYKSANKSLVTNKAVINKETDRLSKAVARHIEKYFPRT